MRLIDADALKENFSNMYRDDYEIWIKEIIDNTPTLPNPCGSPCNFVIPTGEWIMNKTSPRGRNYTCTHCKKISRNKFEYCPKCGAKMKQEAEDDSDS